MNNFNFLINPNKFEIINGYDEADESHHTKNIDKIRYYLCHYCTLYTINAISNVNMTDDLINEFIDFAFYSYNANNDKKRVVSVLLSIVVYYKKLSLEALIKISKFPNNGIQNIAKQNRINRIQLLK